ncbi:hypothetical protein RFI_01207 [Reticulomyxa filosa]|uniref:Alpha-ketoglutarate-dependent dioxygenase AlkB-like domain-containing protein n=1 Tax=Reticulomyxa filosa TaxID=46433 RepID=X6PBD3_RETFI|nr:hypothetical protein RFI_01207 [Reticulomyxa filosa]|eukprot:ETO35855.1 hypothetical protein RFI_01207 [Reticulomyxa filosa]
MTSKEKNITQSTNQKITDDEKFRTDLEAKYTLQLQQDWSTRRRYLDNIRIPPLMPHFTPTGFKSEKLPDDVCQQFTKRSISKRRNSKFHRFFFFFFFSLHANKIKMTCFLFVSFIHIGVEFLAVFAKNKKIKKNLVNKVSTWMMHIPNEKKIWIGDRLRPLLEEWSGTKLQYSTIYGLREYRKGAVLKTHVDRIETHIISAILHVAHEPSLDEAPWPLELVSWDGKRYYVQDDVCSMIYYESSKLIHGITYLLLLFFLSWLFFVFQDLQPTPSFPINRASGCLQWHILG